MYYYFSSEGSELFVTSVFFVEKRVFSASCGIMVLLLLIGRLLDVFLFALLSKVFICGVAFLFRGC